MRLNFKADDLGAVLKRGKKGQTSRAAAYGVVTDDIAYKSPALFGPLRAAKG